MTRNKKFTFIATAITDWKITVMAEDEEEAYEKMDSPRKWQSAEPSYLFRYGLVDFELMPDKKSRR